MHTSTPIVHFVVFIAMYRGRKIAAAATAATAASLLSEPLLSETNHPVGNDDGIDAEVQHDMAGGVIVTAAVCLLAAAGCKLPCSYIIFYVPVVRCLCDVSQSFVVPYFFTVAASAAAMVSIQSIVVFLAGGVCCLNALSVIHRQHLMNSSPSK
jgi:hypothetical protein